MTPILSTVYMESTEKSLSGLCMLRIYLWTQHEYSFVQASGAISGCPGSARWWANCHEILDLDNISRCSFLLKCHSYYDWTPEYFLDILLAQHAAYLLFCRSQRLASCSKYTPENGEYDYCNCEYLFFVYFMKALVSYTRCLALQLAPSYIEWRITKIVLIAMKTGYPPTRTCATCLHYFQFAKLLMEKNSMLALL